MANNRPASPWAPAQKVAFARALAELGVDVIEASFPTVRPPTTARCRPSPASPRLHHRRAGPLPPGDIDACAGACNAARPRIHVFISTSPLHRQHKLGMSRAQVLEHA